MKLSVTHFSILLFPSQVFSSHPYPSSNSIFSLITFSYRCPRSNPLRSTSFIICSFLFSFLPSPLPSLSISLCHSLSLPPPFFFLSLHLSSSLSLTLVLFLHFSSSLCFSGGPLPEELLPQVKVPVRILWGENDPWEPIEMGRKAYGSFPCVDEFVTLPGTYTVI